MTKTELQKSHDDMARFLKHLCKWSDDHWNAYRNDVTERHYQKARRLVARAGLKYTPKATGERDG